MERLTRRYIIKSLAHLKVSKPIRYERYYINDNLRVQKKDNTYQKEFLDKDNNITEKIDITKEEFLSIKADAYQEIIRDSYLLIDNNRISIKKY